MSVRDAVPLELIYLYLDNHSFINAVIWKLQPSDAPGLVAVRVVFYNIRASLLFGGGMISTQSGPEKVYPFLVIRQKWKKYYFTAILTN